MQEVIAFLNSQAPIPEKLSLRLCLNLLKSHTTSKGKHLIKPNEAGNRVYFITKGMYIVYKQSDEGKLQIDWILFPGDVMYATESFLSNMNAGEGILALQNSEAYSITRAELDELEKEYPTLLAIRVKLECDYKLRAIEDNKMREMTLASARYAAFLKKYAQAVKYLSNKQIAAFLRIDASSITKIEKGKSKKQTAFRINIED